MEPKARDSVDTYCEEEFGDEISTTNAAPSMRSSISNHQYDATAPQRTASPLISSSSSPSSPVPSLHSKASSVTLVGPHDSVSGARAAPGTLTSANPYRGFPSEEAYLNALRAWAEEKKYIQPSADTNTLVGLYGSQTLHDKLQGMEKAPGHSLIKKWRQKKAERKQEKAVR